MKNQNRHNIAEEPEFSFKVTFGPNGMVCMVCVKHSDYYA